jgi:hypothetical protein
MMHAVFNKPVTVPSALRLKLLPESASQTHAAVPTPIFVELETDSGLEPMPLQLHTPCLAQKL